MGRYKRLPNYGSTFLILAGSISPTHTFLLRDISSRPKKVEDIGKWSVFCPQYIARHAVNIGARAICAADSTTGIADAH